MSKKIFSYRFIAVLGVLFVGWVFVGVLTVFFNEEESEAESYEKYLPVIGDYSYEVGLAIGEYLEWWVWNSGTEWVKIHCEDVLIEELRESTMDYRRKTVASKSRELRDAPRKYKDRINASLRYLKIDCDVSAAFR